VAFLHSLGNGTSTGYHICNFHLAPTPRLAPLLSTKAKLLISPRRCEQSAWCITITRGEDKWTVGQRSQRMRRNKGARRRRRRRRKDLGLVAEDETQSARSRFRWGCWGWGWCSIQLDPVCRLSSVVCRLSGSAAASAAASMG